MSNLSGTEIKDTYPGVLNIGPAGLTGSLSVVTDGVGNVLPFEVSNTTVNFTGIVTGITGAAGSSGTSGVSGSSGTSGQSGSSGTSGQAGSSGTSGQSGSSGTSGVNGLNGSSGTSGVSGSSGTSGNSGSSGTSGQDGSSGTSGVSGASGSSGTSGQDGSSGTSGLNGSSGTSGLNGSSGTSGQGGSSGTSGISGSSGTSGQDGSSGTSGVNGSSGTSGQDGSSGTSGVSGSSGTSGISGSSGTSGQDGSSGTSGQNGSSGTSGQDGSSGTSGVSGSSGTSGISGSSGTSGVSGSSGTSGANGSSGTSGANGSSGTSGISGSSGTSGISGTSGTSGVSGSSGTSGANGSSGTSGNSGSSGTSGVSGSSGTSGISGSSGTSGVGGSSGTSGVNGTSGTSGAAGSSGTSGISGSPSPIREVNTDSLESDAIGASAGIANNAIAIGSGSIVRCDTAIAFGFNNDVCGLDSFAFGNCNTIPNIVDGSACNLFIGFCNENLGQVANFMQKNVQIGFFNKSCSNNNCNTIIGSDNTTHSFRQSVIGVGNNALGQDSVAIGLSNNARENGIGIGQGNATERGNIIMIGHQNRTIDGGQCITLIGQTNCLKSFDTETGNCAGVHMIGLLNCVACATRTNVFGFKNFLSDACGRNSILIGNENTIFEGATGSTVIGNNSIGATGIVNAAVIGDNLTSEKSNTTHVDSIIAFGQGASKYHSVGNITGTVSLNWNNGNNQSATLTGSVILGLNNPISGGNYSVKLVQDATGSRTVTFPANIYWANSVAPVLSTAANAVDMISIVYDGSNYYGSWAVNFG